MILVKGVHKRYRTEHGMGPWILKDVNLTIPSNVNVGIVGRNGAGKSTLMNLIGGIDVPNKGTIERQCRVSWPLGFGGGLQGSLTGRDNSKFVLRVHGMEAQFEEKIAYIQEFADIGKYFDKPIKTYSSGMKSRLQFALSMCFDFDVYLADEITAVGDVAFARKALNAFIDLTGRAGLIMVSHGEETLRQYCKSGIWINQGHAIWYDDINDALRDYLESMESL